MTLGKVATALIVGAFLFALYSTLAAQPVSPTDRPQVQVPAPGFTASEPPGTAPGRQGPPPHPPHPPGPAPGGGRGRAPGRGAAPGGRRERRAPRPAGRRRAAPAHARGPAAGGR